MAVPAATSAQAAPAGDSFASLVTRGANGFQIVVTRAGNRVFLSASKGNVEAAYAVPAQGMRGEGIRARFGDLGRVAVRFRPPRSRARRPCDPSTALDLGTFRGTIRFRGELGYTAVNRRRARGISFGSLLTGCGPGRASGAAARAGASAGERAPTISTHLAAIRKLRGGSLAVDLLAYRGGAPVVYAVQSETRGKMGIVRTALARLRGENAFRATGPGRHPAYAFLAPPRPFSGSGTFHEGPRSSATWTGSIAVWLPGAGRVPLAGPPFASSLCRRARGEKGCGLYPTVQPPLPENAAAAGEAARARVAQASGSHSQACEESSPSFCSMYRRNSAISSASIP